nr:copia protein [Tanacetum cinerariifolium]
MCDEFAKIMHDEFEMSMMGELNFFLGLQIKQIENGIFFNQSKYIKEMLKKFGLEDSKPMKTPMSSDTKLAKDEDCESVYSTKYRGMIVYAESDHAGDYVDRKSTSGICTFVGCCLTSWFSKKQIALAISTTEAEYVSAEKACQQALWMKQALIDYDDVLIMCDNKYINEQIVPRFILEFYCQLTFTYNPKGQFVVNFVIQNKSFSLTLEEFGQILKIPFKGQASNTKMLSLNHLSVSVPSRGLYKTKPPSPRVIKSIIQVPRKGQGASIWLTRKPRMSVRQVWKRKPSTPKSSPPSQNDSPPFPPRVYLQSPSPPSHNPLRDQMINQLHNISTILDSHTNPSNAYIHAPPSPPPPPQIYPPSHAQVEFHSRFCHWPLKILRPWAVVHLAHPWPCRLDGDSQAKDLLISMTISTEVAYQVSHETHLQGFGSFAISNQTESKVLKALYVNKAKLSTDSGFVAPKYLSGGTSSKSNFTLYRFTYLNVRGKLSDKSDFYAFGVVLHELLIGRRSVENVTISIPVYCHMAKDPLLLQIHPCRNNQTNLTLQNGGLLRMMCLILIMRGGRKATV